jgi:hypothetical protein
MVARLSELPQEVVMPIRVFATGHVAEGPSQLDSEDAAEAVFVLDPFPGPGEAGLAHACEVVCPSRELAMGVMQGIQRGQSVAVTGELKMRRIQGPLEDDLTGVRAWIVASAVRPGADPT